MCIVCDSISFFLFRIKWKTIASINGFCSTLDACAYSFVIFSLRGYMFLSLCVYVMQICILNLLFFVAQFFLAIKEEILVCFFVEEIRLFDLTPKLMGNKCDIYHGIENLSYNLHKRVAADDCYCWFCQDMSTEHGYEYEYARVQSQVGWHLCVCVGKRCLLAITCILLDHRHCHHSRTNGCSMNMQSYEQQANTCNIVTAARHFRCTPHIMPILLPSTLNEDAKNSTAWELSCCSFFIYKYRMAWTFRSLVDCECNIVTNLFNSSSSSGYSTANNIHTPSVCVCWENFEFENSARHHYDLRFDHICFRCLFLFSFVVDNTRRTNTLHTEMARINVSSCVRARAICAISTI